MSHDPHDMLPPDGRPIFTVAGGPSAPGALGGRVTSDLQLERMAFRRRATTRSVLVALISSIVVAVVLVLVVVNTPGWDAVRASFFDPKIALSSFWPVLVGLWTNIKVLLISGACVGLLSMGFAVVRSLRGPVFFPLRFLVTAYTDIFRGIPVIIVLYLVGFGIPALGIFPRMPAALWGGIAITMSYTAYVAEVLRAGMESVHPSQRTAARSLGLTHGQTLRKVIIPQGVRKVVPALMNDFVSMQKDVGLISVLGAIDAVRAAQIITAQTYNYTPYVVAGILFIALSWPMIRVTDAVTVRMSRREQMGGVV